MSQLALPLKLQDHAVFESFLPTGNESAVAYLLEAVTAKGGTGCWLWGPGSTGKTHLLQAVCERTENRAQFVPLKELAAAGPDILEGLHTRPFVCIDDVHEVAGDDDWELGLFALCNSLADAGGTLICAADTALRESQFQLPDLKSRFSRLPIFQLHVLNEDGRVQALQLRARHRGLELPAETANFLLARSKRDMSSLYQILDTLDQAAMKAQRRLTVPFVKEVLDANPSD